MRIERVNPYGQRLGGVSQKAKAEPELLAAKKSPPGEKAVEKRISEQERLKKMAEQMKYEKSQMMQAQESKKAGEEEIKIRTTCLEISRRIISGDKVPQKDHEYLMKHDMELYARSIMMRRHKEYPHEYDQLSEEEESNTPRTAMNAKASGSSESPGPAPKLDEII